MDWGSLTSHRLALLNQLAPIVQLTISGTNCSPEIGHVVCFEPAEPGERGWWCDFLTRHQVEPSTTTASDHKINAFSDWVELTLQSIPSRWGVSWGKQIVCLCIRFQPPFSQVRVVRILSNSAVSIIAGICCCYEVTGPTLVVQHWRQELWILIITPENLNLVLAWDCFYTPKPTC